MGAIRTTVVAVTRMLGLTAVLMFTGCATPEYDHRSSIFQAVPDRWQQANEWSFRITDVKGRPLGDIRLLLTMKPLESEKCDVPGWYRADVIENNLYYGMAAELAPGYLISGPWITVDLAATSCNTGYKMIGTMTASGAAGHFNVVHSLGGEYLGEFVALPVAEE